MNGVVGYIVDKPVELMEHFLKHLKPIAYLLASLILFQSCIVYKSKPASIEEASKYNYRRIKVKTFENGNYKLRWINEEPDFISSVYNTRRVLIDTSRLINIKIYNPEPQEIQLNEALNHEGMIRFKTKDYSYKFFNVEERGEKIYGYWIINSNIDTSTVNIPKENIEAIKLDSKGASAVGTLGVVLVPLLTMGLVGFAIAMSEGGMFSQ